MCLGNTLECVHDDDRKNLIFLRRSLFVSVSKGIVRVSINCKRCFQLFGCAKRICKATKARKMRDLRMRSFEQYFTKF